MSKLKKDGIRVEAIIITYNEQAMIRHILNHYSKFCHKVTFYDNMSTDRTADLALQLGCINGRNIMIPLEQEDKYTKVIKYDTGGQLSDRAYLEIKNESWKKSRADYVIVCDADEFLYYPDNMIEILKKMKADGVTLPKVEGYNMVSKGFPRDYKNLLVDQINQGVRATNFDKQIIFDPKAIADINFDPGAHTCNPTGKIVRSKEALKLLHFKYLGEKYVQKRHKMYAKRLSQFNKDNNLGGQYMQGDEHIKKCFKLLSENKEKVLTHSQPWSVENYAIENWE